MKIKKGDNVKILSGRDRNKTGKVIQVLDMAERGMYVVVEGLNQLKKHMRSNRAAAAGSAKQAGQVIELPSPLHISKVMLIDPKSNKPTRVGFVTEGTEKKRVAKVSKEIIA